jgi:hypothetical protein
MISERRSHVMWIGKYGVSFGRSTRIQAILFRFLLLARGCSSHRPNEWYYHPSADLIFRRTVGGGQYFRRDDSQSSRLSQQRFCLLGPVPLIPDLTGYSVVGVEHVDDGSVILGATGPDRYDPPAIQHDLISLLNSWG